jgi:hypothetical protein
MSKSLALYCVWLPGFAGTNSPSIESTLTEKSWPLGGQDGGIALRSPKK